MREEGMTTRHAFRILRNTYFQYAALIDYTKAASLAIQVFIDWQIAYLLHIIRKDGLWLFAPVLALNKTEPNVCKILPGCLSRMQLLINAVFGPTENTHTENTMINTAQPQRNPRGPFGYSQ